MSFSISNFSSGDNPPLYLVWFATALVAMLGLTAAINVIVDPFRVFRLVEVRGFNEVKPRAAQRGYLTKESGVVATKPSNLILGNSRAEVGFDPESLAWPSGTTYNAAVPGGGTETALAFLKLGVDGGQLRQVLIGLDFQDFLVDPGLQLQEKSAPESRGTESRLSRIRSKIVLATELAFSLDSLLNSWSTVVQQRNSGASDVTRLGFNPMHDYVSLAHQDGYGVLFQQRDEENARNYRRQPHGLFASGSHTSAAFQDLREMMNLCTTNGLRCTFIIYPYHAHILELISLSGLWIYFEDWKREIAHLVDGVSTDRMQQANVLWDFSGYHNYALEPVPRLGDRATQLNWYWEAGHFKRALGEKLLMDIYGQEVERIGTRLDANNIESHLADIRQQQSAFRAARPEVAQALQKLLHLKGTATH